MKKFRKEIIACLLISFLSVRLLAQNTRSSVTKLRGMKIEKKVKKKRKKKVKLPKIDLSHWKVTLPVANKEGKPVEITHLRF